MNERTEKIIRDLSEKLGTTTEHLWNVLIRQAPITATIELITSILLIIAGIIGWNYLSKLKLNEFDKAPMYTIAVILISFCIIFILCSLPMQIAGLLNPEYWALKQIIK